MQVIDSIRVFALYFLVLCGDNSCMVNDIFVDEKVAFLPDSGFEWIMDASDVGLRVGELPRSISTSLGNKQPFLLTRVSEDSFFYRQQFGCLTLRVFND